MIYTYIYLHIREFWYIFAHISSYAHRLHVHIYIPGMHLRAHILGLGGRAMMTMFTTLPTPAASSNKGSKHRLTLRARGISRRFDSSNTSYQHAFIAREAWVPNTAKTKKHACAIRDATLGDRGFKLDRRTAVLNLIGDRGLTFDGSIKRACACEHAICVGDSGLTA